MRNCSSTHSPNTNEPPLLGRLRCCKDRNGENGLTLIEVRNNIMKTKIYQQQPINSDPIYCARLKERHRWWFDLWNGAWGLLWVWRLSSLVCSCHCWDMMYLWTEGIAEPINCICRGSGLLCSPLKNHSDLWSGPGQVLWVQLSAAKQEQER